MLLVAQTEMIVKGFFDEISSVFLTLRGFSLDYLCAAPCFSLFRDYFCFHNVDILVAIIQGPRFDLTEIHSDSGRCDSNRVTK